MLDILGGAAFAMSKKKKKNLIILISNTYTGLKELPGVRQDRKNIIKAIGWNESDYNRFFSERYLPVQFKKSTSKDFRLCLLTNCSRKELIRYINEIKVKYDYSNIILCIAGHGMNSTGLIAFETYDNKLIQLSEIVQEFNTDKLLNLTILLDLCRTGNYIDERASYQLLSNIIDKRVAVMTAGWRGEAGWDTVNGGYLIQALVKTINENYYQFINGLLSFKYTLNILTDIISNYLTIRLEDTDLSVRKWEELVHTNSENPPHLKVKREICKILPSIYLNSEARKYLENYPTKLGEIKSILKILCRDYNDIRLSIAAVNYAPTKMKI
jgi:hypothetical protein